MTRKIKYSPTTKGFYLPDHAGSVPADAVEITEAEWHSLLDRQEQGDEIVMSAGRPVAQAPPPPPPPTAAEIAAAKDAAADRLLQRDAAMKSLAGFVFDLWGQLNAMDPARFPAMTRAQFRQQIKNRM